MIFFGFPETIGVEYNDGFTRKKIIPNPGLEGNYLEMKRILNEVPEYKQTDDFLKRSMIAASNCRSEDEKQEKTSLFRYEDQLAYMAKYEESNRKIAIEFWTGRMASFFGNRLSGCGLGSPIMRRCTGTS